MDDWILLNPKDLEIYLMGYQVELLQTVVLGKDEPNPLPELIVDTVRRLRRDIYNGGNPLSADRRLIPPELRATACALILENLQVRIPGMKLSPGQQDAARNGRRELENIAGGKIAVLRPIHVAKNTPFGKTSNMVRVFSHSQVSRKTLEGL